MSDLFPPGDESGPPTGGAGDGMGSILGMALEMQQQLVAAQAAAAAEVVEGQAGGGAVRVEVTGGLEFRSVTIRPDAIDPDDPELLGDLVLAAIHDAMARVQEIQQQAVGPLGGALDQLGGGGLGDLFGGALSGGGPGTFDDEDDEDDEDHVDDEDDEDHVGDDGGGAG